MLTKIALTLTWTIGDTSRTSSSEATYDGLPVEDTEEMILRLARAMQKAVEEDVDASQPRYHPEAAKP